MLVTHKIMVGIAEIKVAQEPTLFHCLGLGSCIGLGVYDPRSGVAGMVHIMLPEAFKNKPVEKPGKFADTGIPELISELEKAGAVKRRMVAVYAGGASVFQFGNGSPNTQDIGDRNAQKVAEIVDAIGIPIKAVDVGGSNGRSVFMCTHTGAVKVKTIRQGEVELCNMKG